MNLISTNEAIDIILSCNLLRETETAKLSDSLYRILAENIYSDRDFPPFDQVRMDGIAIDFKEFQDGCRSFIIQGIQAAGQKAKQHSQEKSCLEVMTGSVLPIGTNTVIRYEDLLIQNATATIQIEDIIKGQNVQKKGSYRPARTLLIPTSTRIESPEIGILASIGKTTILVRKNPSVCIVSTGDELIAPSQLPEPHQIRRSNSYKLQSEITKLGLNADVYHYKDEPEVLKKGVGKLLDQYQILIFSGAVSKGKFDYLPGVFTEKGVVQRFHGVKQRPGKPFWFGTTARNLIFAFPGNPISSFLCYHKYFRPWIYRNVFSIKQKKIFAKLTEDFAFNPQLSYFLLVTTQVSQDGCIWATPVPGKGSGDLVNLLQADAFLELPAKRSHFSKAESFPLILFR